MTETRPDRTPDPRHAELAAARATAAALLASLLDDRRDSETRLAEDGVSDPVKSLTGQSALDRAIRETQDVLDRLDQALAEGGTNGRSHGDDANGRSAARGTPRAAARPMQSVTNMQPAMALPDPVRAPLESWSATPPPPHGARPVEAPAAREAPAPSAAPAVPNAATAAPAAPAAAGDRASDRQPDRPPTREPVRHPEPEPVHASHDASEESHR